MYVCRYVCTKDQINIFFMSVHFFHEEENEQEFSNELIFLDCQIQGPML
jgi:hypothetical protein